MNSESLVSAFLEAEKNGASVGSYHMSLSEICNICIDRYKEKYGIEMMDTVKLVEEMDELMVAILGISGGDETRPSWRLSPSWFNLVEELEDVDIMLCIVNQVLNSQLGTTEDLYIEHDSVLGRQFTSVYFVRELGLEIQMIMKGLRKQFNPTTESVGREIVQSQLNRVYLLCHMIRDKFHIRESDISRMRYVKVTRLMDKYGISKE